MKASLSNLKNQILLAGGTLEEDTRGLDVRHFNMIAPAGKVWAASGLTEEPIKWARRDVPTAKLFNQNEFNSVMEILSFGTENN